MNDAERVARAEKLLQYQFRQPRLLLHALTHRSFVNEFPEDAPEGHNERLEFLGDAVLSLAATDALVGSDPHADEGALSKRRAAYVSEAALFAAAARVGFGDCLRMGKGQRKGGGAQLPSLVSDAVEAVFAAVYLDGGFEAAKSAIHALLGEPPAVLEEAAPDPKTVLQEKMQQVGAPSPTYQMERAGGPDHAPRYKCSVCIAQWVLGVGEGANKKNASREAARDALRAVDGMDVQQLRAHIGGKRT